MFMQLLRGWYGATPSQCFTHTRIYNDSDCPKLMAKRQPELTNASRLGMPEQTSSQLGMGGMPQLDSQRKSQQGSPEREGRWGGSAAKRSAWWRGARQGC